MIGLFGSAAGRAILNTLPNKSHQQQQQHRRQPPPHAGMIAKSKSLDYEFLNEKHRTDDATTVTLSKLHKANQRDDDDGATAGAGAGARRNSKKTVSGFWKLFESEKVKSSLEDISSSSSKHR